MTPLWGWLLLAAVLLAMFAAPLAVAELIGWWAPPAMTGAVVGVVWGAEQALWREIEGDKRRAAD